MCRASANHKSVCIITEADGYGCKTHAFDLARKLLERGYSVELVSCVFDIFSDCAREWNETKLKFLLTPLSTYDRKYTSAVWDKFLKEIESPIVILERSSMYFGTHAFLFSCRKRFSKVYYIHHYNDDAMPKKKIKTYFGGMIRGVDIGWHAKKFRRGLKALYANRIIAVSGFIRNHLIDDWGYPPKKVTCVYNGIYWQKYARNKNLGAEFRQKYKIASQATVFGILTRLDYEKGIDLAINALGILMKKHRGEPIYLVIAGHGQEYDKLDKLKKDLGLKQNVVFCGFLADPRPALSSFDILLATSRKESFGLSVVEAMASGCIPIITAVGGMKEIVTGSECGWIVPPKNFEELSRAMEEALKTDEETRERIRQNALNRVKEHFNADINYQKILDVCGIV